jgi:hypothetical protein
MLAPLTPVERDRLRAYLTKMAGHSCSVGSMGTTSKRCG